MKVFLFLSLPKTTLQEPTLINKGAPCLRVGTQGPASRPFLPLQLPVAHLCTHTALQHTDSRGGLPVGGCLCRPSGSGRVGKRPCLGLCSLQPWPSSGGGGACGLWSLGGAKEDLLTAPNSLMLKLVLAPSALSSLFLLLLGLTFSFRGVCLAWREGPSPHRTPQGLCSGGKSQMRAQQCHQLTTTPVAALAPCPACSTAVPLRALHTWGCSRPLAMALHISCWCLRVGPTNGIHSFYGSLTAFMAREQGRGLPDGVGRF